MESNLERQVLKRERAPRTSGAGREGPRNSGCLSCSPAKSQFMGPPSTFVFLSGFKTKWWRGRGDNLCAKLFTAFLQTI